jgi:uncharacterized protein (DUF1015 family)
MAHLFPFQALRPAPEFASDVAAVPYDVVSTAEARALASENPLSFLKVTRAEIDLPPDTNPYDAQVYEQAARNFEVLKRSVPMVLDQEPALYLYRLRMNAHEQVGLAGCFSLDEYDRDLIKKHEKTRREKEDDRTRHIVELRAQTGLVFLTYHASAAVTAVRQRVLDTAPLYDFTAPDGVAHAVWRVTGSDATALVEAFAALPALYIADGHHRMASAARARETLAGAGGSSKVVAVAFPDDEVQILAYNRVVKDLAGQTPGAFLASLSARMPVSDGPAVPTGPGRVSMYLDGKWHAVTLPTPPGGTAPAETLDVDVLSRQVLEPLLQIGDIRSDTRVDFIGGARGTAELERQVIDGHAAVAFSMFPVRIADLLAIADAGGIMPPKSTWFEPKLRDGLLVHLV